MTEYLYKSISDILPDFFNSKQIKEFQSLYRSSVIDQSNSNAKKETLDKLKISDGLTYRTQVDLLVTYSSGRLSKEKFLSLLLYLSQVSITSGEFATAIEINEKIIFNTSNEKDFADISANAYLLIGEIYSRQANWQNSFDYIQQARELFESVNDVRGIAKCENLLGTIYGDLGDMKNAIENFEAALGKTEEETNYIERAKIEINLGIVNNIKGL